MNPNKKICVITGCNTGIGKPTAIGMAKMNYRVVMLVRDSEKSRLAYKEIKSESRSNSIEIFFVDLSSQQSIITTTELVQKQIKSIDVLINNAGILKRKQEMSVDGHEMTLAVNFLAPFLLTSLLLPLIEKSESGRIVNLTSELYKRGKVNFDKPEPHGKFNGNKTYANSKLLLVLFTKELATRLAPKGISVNCIHPGVAGTEAFREYPRWFNVLLNLFISKAETVSMPVIHLSTEEKLKNTTGQYFYKNSIKKTIANTSNEEFRRNAWDFATRLTNL